MDTVLAGIIGGKMDKIQLKPAGETLASGELVTNLNGTIYKPKRAGFQVLGDDILGQAVGTELLSERIDDTRTLVVYKYSDNEYGIRIITVNGDGVEYGTEYVAGGIFGGFYIVTSAQYQSLVVLDTGRALLVLYDAVNKKIRGRVIFFSGNTITDVGYNQVIDTYAGTNSWTPQLGLSKNDTSGDVMLTYTKEEPVGSNNAHLFMSILAINNDNNEIIDVLHTLTEDIGEPNRTPMYTPAVFLTEDKILIPYTRTFSSGDTTHGRVVVAEGVSSRSMSVVYDGSYEFNYIYNIVRLSDSDALFVSDHYNYATDLYEPRIGIITAGDISATTSDVATLTDSNETNYSRIVRISESAFMHVTRFSADNPNYPNKFAVRMVHVINGVVELGELVFLTNLSLTVPTVNVLSATSMLITASAGATGLFNKFVSVIADSPMQGITITASSVDLDGIEKVAYVPF